MARWHLRSRRKPTGGLLKRHSKKKRQDRGRDFVPTLLAESEKRKAIRVRGGNLKLALRTARYVNVATPEGVRKAEIKTVLENRANPNWVRRNIITKGVIVETDLGKVRITSRPNQDGVLNGVLVAE